jgi:ubiquitin carboxyl-terminal hydrolase 34
MWQMCGYIPQTLLSQQPDVTEMAAQLSASFFLETFIHAKEKVASAEINYQTL